MGKEFLSFLDWLSFQLQNQSKVSDRHIIRRALVPPLPTIIEADESLQELRDEEMDNKTFTANETIGVEEYFDADEVLNVYPLESSRELNSTMFLESPRADGISKRDSHSDAFDCPSSNPSTRPQETGPTLSSVPSPAIPKDRPGFEVFIDPPSIASKGKVKNSATEPKRQQKESKKLCQRQPKRSTKGAETTLKENSPAHKNVTLSLATTHDENTSEDLGPDVDNIGGVKTSLRQSKSQPLPHAVAEARRSSPTRCNHQPAQ